MEERTRTKTNGRILLQIAYIEGKPNVRVNTKTSEREMKRGANSCDASAFVWVGNHQKLVVCLRASLLYTTQWCCALENGNRIHILHNIHLFFTQFHRLSPSLFRSFHNHLPVRLFALTFLSHFFSLALLFQSPTFNHSVFMSKNFSHEEKPIKFYILPFYYISFRFPKHHFKLAILWVILDLLIHIQISLNPFMTVNSGVD